MKNRALDVLLVEDNEADARYTREILKDASFPVNLFRACDGVEALSFLYRQERYVSAPQPDLVLLDLTLPRVDGRDLLEVLKSDESLACIPIIILTGSYSISDRAYTLHREASFYLPKPLNLAQFEQTIFELSASGPTGSRRPQGDELSFNHLAFRILKKWFGPKDSGRPA
jgi:two-component system response regulator